MTTIINGSSPSITFSDGSAQTSATRPFQNRIINGAMVIDQRNAGASFNNSTSGVYSVDRWKTYGVASAKFSIQQNAGSVTPPAGFVNYLGVTSLAATTPGSSDQYDVYQLIEGYNIADLNWGSANAKTVTLSFWVRSSLTGTFGGVLKNTAANRSYPFSYTISAANTWEQKSITVVGCPDGTWETTTSTGIIVLFNMGGGSSLLGTAGAWASANYVGVTGQTNIVATSGATWFITGVQLEVGSTATSFDYRPYGTELALCYRYYWNLAKGDTAAIGNGCYHGTTQVRTYVNFPVTMRTEPSLVATSGSSYYQMELSGTSDQFNSFTIYRSAVNGAIIYNASEISGTNLAAGTLNNNNASASVSFSAEL
jgi:hypothetical protein